MEAAQPPRKHHIGQRSIVCSRDDEGLEQLAGDSNKTFNDLSPANRWADRKGKLGVRTVSKGFHRP